MIKLTGKDKAACMAQVHEHGMGNWYFISFVKNDNGCVLTLMEPNAALGMGEI